MLFVWILWVLNENKGEEITIDCEHNKTNTSLFPDVENRPPNENSSLDFSLENLKNVSKYNSIVAMSDELIDYYIFIFKSPFSLKMKLRISNANIKHLWKICWGIIKRVRGKEII